MVQDLDSLPYHTHTHLTTKDNMSTNTKYEIRVVIVSDLDYVPLSKLAAANAATTLSFDTEEEARSVLSMIQRFVRNGRIGRLSLPHDDDQDMKQWEADFNLLCKVEDLLGYDGYIDQIFTFQKVCREDLTF